MELWCQQIEHLPSFFCVIAFASQIEVFPPDSLYDKSKTVSTELRAVCWKPGVLFNE